MEFRRVLFRSQPLATALREFAQQSGQELLFSPEVAAEKVTGGIKITSPPLEALSTLLHNTGISFSITPNDAILLRSTGAPSQSPGAGVSEDGTTTMDVVSVTGTRIKGATPPSPLISIDEAQIGRASGREKVCR